MDEGYIVQYYDEGTKAWRNRGSYYSNTDRARTLANKLFKLKAGQMAVRVRFEHTYYNIKKVTK